MRHLSTLALAAAVGLVCILACAHATGDDAGPATAAFHGTAGWWGALAPLVLGGCLLGGRWRLAALAVLPTLAWLVWVVPGTLRAQPVPEGAVLRIVSANVLMVNPDPTGALLELFAGDPDLVVLQEYSPRFAEVAAVHRRTHPYTFERPEAHSFGTAVFSRWPLEELEEQDLAGVPLVAFTLTIADRRVRMFVVHTLPPVSAGNVDRWRLQLAALAERAAAEDGPLVVAGDLNATRHHPSFRKLLATGGLRDAHAEIGRAAAVTWPNGVFLLPPLRLDHLLLGGAVVAEQVEEGSGRGSDHRSVKAVLRLPERPRRPRAPKPPARPGSPRPAPATRARMAIAASGSDRPRIGLPMASRLTWMPSPSGEPTARCERPVGTARRPPLERPSGRASASPCPGSGARRR